MFRKIVRRLSQIVRRLSQSREPVEIPRKLQKAIEESSVSLRESGVLIIGLGPPFFYEQASTALKSRTAEYGLSKRQMDLATEMLQRQARHSVREMKMVLKEERRQRNGWNQPWRYRRE